MALMALISVNMIFSWTFKVFNLTPEARPLRATYGGVLWMFGKCLSCCDDNVVIPAGEHVEINAYECLLTGLHTPNGSSYTSSGQRVYKEFYITGPVRGSYRVGRIQGEDERRRYKPFSE